jgi:hypothetical protein
VQFDEFKAKLAASRQKHEQKSEQKAPLETSSDVSTPSRQPPLEPSALSGTKQRQRSVRKPSTDAPDVQRDTLPHSVEAEQGVISSILQDCQKGQRRLIAQVASKINEQYFYVPAHRMIYQMLVSLWRANRPIDLISFTEFLRHKSVLPKIGGPAAVNELFLYVDKLVGFTCTDAAIDYYTDIVIEKFARREIAADAASIVRGVYGDSDAAFCSRVQRLTNRMMNIINVSSNGQFPQMQDTAEFFTRESPPLPPLVICHLLHQGSKMLLGGNSKGRKTWALLELAVSVACGVDWWGFNTRRGAVCYINLEIQPQFFEERLKKICEVKQVQPEAGALWHWPLRGYAKPMDALVKELLGFLKQHRFSLVIIDPIYKTLPSIRGSENDSAMITQLLNEVESITVETKAAVLFCSHFSKGDQSEKESMDRVSGSGAWARDPDTLLTMTPHEEEECFTVEATLRNLKPIKPFVVKWDYPLFVRQQELAPDRLKKRRGAAEPKYTLTELVELLDEPLRACDYYKRAHDDIGMSSRQFYNMFAELKKNQMITETGDRQWKRKDYDNTAFAADADTN